MHVEGERIYFNEEEQAIDPGKVPSAVFGYEAGQAVTEIDELAEGAFQEARRLRLNSPIESQMALLRHTRLRLLSGNLAALAGLAESPADEAFDTFLQGLEG